LLFEIETRSAHGFAFVLNIPHISDKSTRTRASVRNTLHISDNSMLAPTWGS
jgi:hypothetical protein